MNGRKRDLWPGVNNTHVYIDVEVPPCSAHTYILEINHPAILPGVELGPCSLHYTPDQVIGSNDYPGWNTQDGCSQHVWIITRRTWLSRCSTKATTSTTTTNGNNNKQLHYPLW
jgi:hypothetical protein